MSEFFSINLLFTLKTFNYDVYAKWTANANRASNATYIIEHANGSDTLSVNQQLQGGQWNLLGTYTLDSSSRILLSNVADGYVVSDGIKLIENTALANPLETLYYYHNDHLGTPRFMTNYNQDIVWQGHYMPFGQVLISTETIVNNLRFPGQYYDSETGFYYNYFRYYDPELGGYITSDPIGLAGGINTYTYVHNNPLKFIDPFGLDSLVANNATLTHYNDSGNVVGTYPYTTGQDGVTDPSIPWQGPIPPGNYSLDPSQISGGDFWTTFRRNLFQDWGTYRAPLTPGSPTNTYGRDGFFLHGGSEPGSAGCIDIGSGDKTLFPNLTGHDGPIPVTVK